MNNNNNKELQSKFEIFYNYYIYKMNNILKEYKKKELQNIAVSLGLSKWGTKLELYKRIQNTNDEFNVLIMCQRKPTNNTNNANIATKLAENFVLNELGLHDVNIKIEFLVDEQPCNHCIQLGTNTQEVWNYVTNNKRKYDIVLFYTCPLPFMMEVDGTNQFLYDQLKIITKPDTLYLFGYRKGVKNFDYFYQVWKNKKNQRFNFKRITTYTSPVYILD
jgi:hypothetical protein